MKEAYVRPEANVVSFVPQKAIASQTPGWGWEDDLFSAAESISVFDDD